MAKVAISLEENDTEELRIIVMDEDKEGALLFLKNKILSQVLRKDKRNLNIQGKSHL